MQSRDRIITAVGGGAIILALLLISRCGSEEGIERPESAPTSGAPTQTPLPFAAPTGERRSRSYTGPSLDQLIADGRRRTVQSPFVSERQPDGVADAQAMFGGDRVEPSGGKFNAQRQQARRLENPNISTGALTPGNTARPAPITGSSAPVNLPFTPVQVAQVAPSRPTTEVTPPPTDTATSDGTSPSPTTPTNGDGAASPALGASTGSTGSGGATNLFTGIDLQAILDSVGAGNGGTGNGNGNGTTTPPANRAPTLTSLSAAPVVAAAGSPLALSAAGVSDPDAGVTGAAGGTITRVQFFRDSNANGTLDATTDELLGSDTTGTDGYVLLTSVNAAWGSGAVRFFARAVDSAAAFSAPVTALVNVNRPPSIGALAASAGVVASGGTVTLTASGVLDPDPAGGAAERVEIYLDTNNDSLISDADTLLASPAVAGGSASASAAVSGSPGQTVRLLARAVDQLGAQSPTTAAATVRVNSPPSAGGLAISNPTPSPGASVTLTASGLADADPSPGGLASVSFYFDADNSGAISPADTLIATVATNGSGASAAAAVPLSGNPTLRYLARANDALGATGNTVSVTAVTNRAPAVSTLAASPAPRVLAPLTLTATATDPDAPSDSVTAVRFYVDSNGNALFDAGDESLGTDATPGDGFTITVECRAAWSPTARFYAVAADSRGLSSAAFPSDIASSPFPDTALRVRSGAASGGDGLTWAGALATPGEALQVAARTGGVVTELWVAAGTYTTALSVSQPISILGGFSGTEFSSNARDWNANRVVLSGGGVQRVIDVSPSVAAFTLDGVTVSSGAADAGAGVRSAALATTIAHCVFRGCVSGGQGGAAVHLTSIGSGTRIVNSLFDANTANGAGRGGAVLIDSAPSGALIANCTVVANTTASGGAIHIGSGTLSIANSIVAFNNAGVFATAAAGVTLTNCATFSNAGMDTAGPVVNVAPVAGDPLFVNAAVSDYRLSAGSPCIDAGTSSQPPAEFEFDLAHQLRRVDADAVGGPLPDLGAYEAACSPPPCPGDFNGDGAVNTADLVFFLGQFGAAAPGPADLNSDGAVNTADLVIFLGRFGAICPRCGP